MTDWFLFAIGLPVLAGVAAFITWGYYRMRAYYDALPSKKDAAPQTHPQHQAEPFSLWRAYREVSRNRKPR